MNPIPDYPPEPEVKLPQRGTWPAAVHCFDPDEVAALRAAEAAGRPLLVRGKPGVGKSQLARAAAESGGRRFVWAMIDGRTEASDLLWRYDAVQRLAEAQRRRGKLRSVADFLSPGPFWAALDWAGAEQRFTDTGLRRADWMDDGALLRARAEGRPSDERVVILVDEIDKADPDLPNALLEVLANDGFTIPLAGAPRVACAPNLRPLIVITTNEERELPPAFIRRCFSITLRLPDDRGRLVDRWVAQAQRHQEFLVSNRLRGEGQVCSEAVLRRAAELVADARLRVADEEGYQPATAEYLDLVRAVSTLYEDEATQLARLDELKRFAVDKSLSA